MATTEPKLDWPIYVVSLKDAEERRARITAALSGRGLDFEFVEAVDGRSGLSAAYEAKVDRAATLRDAGRPLADAEYACAFSHLSVFEKIVSSGRAGAIVLEDDAILTPLFDEFLAARGFERAALVQLDHMDADIWRSERPVPLTKSISLARAARNASLTTGYTISRDGARYFLENSLPLSRPADWPADPLAIGGMITLPRAVDHPPFDTKTSALEGDRARNRVRKTAWQRATRYFGRGYWQRWWFKRRTRRVS